MTTPDFPTIQAAAHIPVMLAEVMAALAPRAGGVYVDATFGAGGYTRAILDTDGTRVIALDRDPRAILAGAPLVAATGGRLTLIEARFGDLGSVLASHAGEHVDGIVFDVGVSSMQIDEAARGFSFTRDGPLDMRMEARGRSAAEIVNEEDEATLTTIFREFGEERMARRLARAIVHDRDTTPFETTRQLAGLAARVIPHKPGHIHPATRAFQALRIVVNDELGELERGLAAAEAALAPGGRLAVVSFHSLEDRIVKRFIADRTGRGRARSRLLPGEPEVAAPTFEATGPQPAVPSEAEMAANPRARSAKLRFASRTSAPARNEVARQQGAGATSFAPRKRT